MTESDAITLAEPSIDLKKAPTLNRIIGLLSDALNEVIGSTEGKAALDVEVHVACGGNRHATIGVEVDVRETVPLDLPTIPPEGMPFKYAPIGEPCPGIDAIELEMAIREARSNTTAGIATMAERALVDLADLHTELAREREPEVPNLAPGVCRGVICTDPACSISRDNPMGRCKLERGE